MTHPIMPKTDNIIAIAAIKSISMLAALHLKTAGRTGPATLTFAGIIQPSSYVFIQNV